MNKVDLYLWRIPNNDNLWRIANIDFDKAEELAIKWFGGNDNNDYMIVLVGSTPWVDPEPAIIDISPEWIDNNIEGEYLNEGTD